MMTRADELFEIRHERTDAHDHYYCADYEWRVIDRRSGAEVLSFSEEYQGGSATGASSVKLDDATWEVVVEDHDGTTRRVPLPKPTGG